MLNKQKTNLQESPFLILLTLFLIIEMDEQMNAGDKAIRDKFVRSMNNLFDKHNVDFGPYKTK